MNEKESVVSSYCREFPVRFSNALGSEMYDANGNTYLDFLTGCGSLNYGHNHKVLSEALIKYIKGNGIAHGLDLETEAKSEFIETFHSKILAPRNMEYKFQFTGPTGTNAVEAAIKLARKITGRTNVVCFTNGFHGCTLGALSLTGNRNHRGGSAHLLGNVSRMPFDGYLGERIDTADILEKMLSDSSSGMDEPAAIILETVQGEGGLNVATPTWAKKIESIARKYGALIIVDDIQIGCGRSGDFFSFESLGIVPDIVTMAKSVSGFGLPMSIVLIRPECDQWAPSEHNGTFRGNSHAFVTATAAIKCFWSDSLLQQSVLKKMEIMKNRLIKISCQGEFTLKGKGFMQGIDFGNSEFCAAVKKACFKKGLIIETAGPNDEVLKLMPALNISEEKLINGLSLIDDCVRETQKLMSAEAA